jgi:hypothetical protein
MKGDLTERVGVRDIQHDECHLFNQLPQVSTDYRHYPSTLLRPPCPRNWHAGPSRRHTIIKMRSILKRTTTSACGTSASNVPRTCALSDPDTLAKNTSLNANSWATSKYKRPIIKQPGRRDVIFKHQNAASTWPKPRRQSRRSKSRNRSYYSAASMSELKSHTQEFRKIIREVKRFQSTRTYSVSPLSSPNIS